MKRISAVSTAFLFALATVACAGGDDAGEAEGTDGATAQQPAGQDSANAGGGQAMSADWVQIDGNNVTIDLVAGSDDTGNYWNFNGYQNGEVTVTVPEGASVTINFSNEDPNMAHSVGVAEFTSSPPASLPAEPVFAGAISSNPTDMMNATMTGQSETITFTADQAGEYSLACYIPGHAVSGMWIKFNVGGGEPGVSGAM